MQLEDIRKISVIGVGIMGHGIGLTYALGGYNVTLNARRETSLSNALKHIRYALGTFVEGGLISQDMLEATLSRITTTTHLEEAVKDADFVTEAVPDDTEVKTKLFGDLDVLCPEHIIFASNTATLTLQDFTAQCKRKDKVLTTHWINPPHIVPLVEIAHNEDTSDETVELIYALLKKVKKMPVKILKELPGLVHNRIQDAMIREVWSLWEQGIASPEDIDLIVKGGFGFRLAAIGPLETCDLGDVGGWYEDTSRLFKMISDAKEPPEALKRMVEAGELGLKSGKGFFNYATNYFDKGEDESVKRRDKKFIQLLKLLYS